MQLFHNVSDRADQSVKVNSVTAYQTIQNFWYDQWLLLLVVQLQYTSGSLNASATVKIKTVTTDCLQYGWPYPEAWDGLQTRLFHCQNIGNSKASDFTKDISLLHCSTWSVGGLPNQTCYTMIVTFISPEIRENWLKIWCVSYFAQIVGGDYFDSRLFLFHVHCFCDRSIQFACFCSMYIVFVTDPYNSFSKCEHFLSDASTDTQNFPL